MTTVEIAGRLIQIVAVALGITLARRQRAYRPIAWFLVVTFVAEYVRFLITCAIGALPTPYTGAARLAFHLDQALLLLWPFGVAAICVRVYSGRSPRAIAIGYAVTTAAVALSYPALRKLALAWAYAAIHAATFVIAFACFIGWTRKQYRDRTPVEAAHEAAGLLCAIQVAVLTVAPDPFTRWHYAHISYGLLFLLLSVIEAFGLRHGAGRAE